MLFRSGRGPGNADERGRCKYVVRMQTREYLLRHQLTRRRTVSNQGGAKLPNPSQRTAITAWNFPYCIADLCARPIQWLLVARTSENATRGSATEARTSHRRTAPYRDPDGRQTQAQGTTATRQQAGRPHHRNNGVFPTIHALRGRSQTGELVTARCTLYARRHCSWDRLALGGVSACQRKVPTPTAGPTEVCQQLARSFRSRPTMSVRLEHEKMIG